MALRNSRSTSENYARSSARAIGQKENILIAVAGAETDGTSGIRDANDATLRQEIEKFAHVIFASSPAQRDFWLGRKSGVGVDQLRERYNGCKPCLHGSDAHTQATVAKPDGDRYSWIKGALEFDALRHAYIDPAGRAYVGPRPPFRATPARVIAEIELTGADWAQTPKVALNPGLVAIIGARGSGKTALADAIAAGCDATDGRLSNASFIVRAREHLDGVGVRLSWKTGDPSARPLLDDSFDPSLYPRARYLSQKFVEELFRINRAPMALRTTKQNFVGAHLDDKAWEVFRQTYAGNVDGTLTDRLAKAVQETAAWRGKELPPKANDQEPYVSADAELKQLSLGELEAEIGRIQGLINIDTDTANRLRTITTKIGDENAALKRLKDLLNDCEGAAARTTQLQVDREQAYLRVFESIVAEEQVLHALYRPLMDRLAQATGTLRKLSFSVSRHADVYRWAMDGETLFDKRRTGPFKGVGTLEAWAATLLKPAWETGDPKAVAKAMAGFRQAHQGELLGLSEVPRA
ncbi:ATP-binding protein [Bradyrhizobium sp. B124]|uniref:ATP-binding protein n=1 Tax=Bradyrhizobium sp. B124 TaxID=3140245 RepID=UPI0031831764